MCEKKWGKVIVISDSGKASWGGGAYTIAFVYSNKGNFIVKGYYKEVGDYLKKLKTKGYKFIVNKTLWYRSWDDKKQFRNIWDTSNPTVYLFTPRKDKNKWELSGVGKSLTFKRLPKKWVPEFNDVI